MNTSSPSRTSIATQAFLRWIQCGVILTLLFPKLRGFDAQFGWWPMWLVALPLACLLLLRPGRTRSVAKASRPRWMPDRPAARQAVRYRRASSAP